MPGMVDSLNVMGQEDAASNIMTINGPQGPMQIDISGMMPEDAEMIIAVAQDAEEAGDPETKAQMMQLLQQLLGESQQFGMLNDMSSLADSRGGPNMMTPVGNVSQGDIDEAQRKKARARHQPYTGHESSLYPGMKF